MDCYYDATELRPHFCEQWCLRAAAVSYTHLNVKDAAIEQIKLGLHEEGSAKEYIDSTDLTDENINGFLRKVFFVIDDGKKPSEYVKAIIRQHPNICLLYTSGLLCPQRRPDRRV